MRFRYVMISFLAMLVLAAVAVGPAAAEAPAMQNWPGWRGDGSGISSETGLPVYWSATENVVWKTPLPAGNSSPVIWGDRVFITAWAEAGAKRMVICLDAKDGKILWQKDFAADRVAKTYDKNGYASSTCATDGERVFAFFDSPGLVAFDMDGNELWKRDLGPYKTDWGMAASPILYKDYVIVNCDQDDGSFIAAFSKDKGEERWRTPRPGQGRQYATPLLITVDGKDQVVVNGGKVLAYNPADGKELWWCRGMISMLTPSAVSSDGIVYVTSGRNGPTMAIDPSGRGDVTDTHVRWHVTTGGPYVPSPLVQRFCVLPGDNGAMRFIDLRTGAVAAETRVRAHFTSSPVIGGGLIYWASEKGDVFVIELSRGAKPKATTLSVNALGEKVLASPAIAGGRIFIRGEKHLFCIAGAGKGKGAPLVAAEQRPLDDIMSTYDAHKEAPEGPDVALRLDLVEQCVGRREPEVFEFLKTVAQKENHWDVSEAAVKALCTYDKDAVPAMIEVYKTDWRPYLKVSPAQAFARLKAPEAVPALLEGMKHGDQIVRLESLKALAQIALAADAEAVKVVPVVLGSLGDREGPVRRAAAESAALLARQIGAERDDIVKKLLDCAADRNPLVRPAAMDALKALKVSEEIAMRDVILFGEQRREPVVHFLNAGPIRAKFQDGELRYLCVGDKEIVRRIYFAVRDERWDTVMPEFSAMNVQKQENGFKITMNAVSRNDVADFTW
ncbi:MAG TPA: PQQ-binding-like beta-propeller repeat protein, partial [Planctomycetota bacterium]|nr:PQQ-binding-like beta-propeller repeat protein [Planctomycetota bacterium]